MGSWADDSASTDIAAGRPKPEWIPNAIAPVCAAAQRANLVAVCDLKRDLVERMQERWRIAAGYADFREMIEVERPDIVTIVTRYASTHAEIAAAVAESGYVRGIYCEKPMATSMAEADRIVAACRLHSVFYSCAYVYRWNARFRHVRAWIADGAIGEVRSISCHGMGALLHMGTHQADVMAGLDGDSEPDWAIGVVDVPPGVPQSEWPKSDPPGSGLIQMKTGTQLLIDGRSPRPRTYQVSGTEGRILIWNDFREVQLWRAREGAARADLMAEPMVSPAQEKSPTFLQFEELADALDRGAAISCDAHAAARTLEMMLGLHLSHQEGGARVRFPLANRTFGVDTA